MLSSQSRLARAIFASAQQPRAFVAVPRVAQFRPQPVRFFGSAPAFLDRAEVQERVLTILKSIEKVDANKVSADVAFSEVGLDSLDTVELVMALEDDFSIEIGDEDAEKILTTKDAIDFISTHPGAK